MYEQNYYKTRLNGEINGEIQKQGWHFLKCDLSLFWKCQLFFKFFFYFNFSDDHVVIICNTLIYTTLYVVYICRTISLCYILYNILSCWMDGYLYGQWQRFNLYTDKKNVLDFTSIYVTLQWVHSHCIAVENKPVSSSILCMICVTERLNIFQRWLMQTSKAPHPSWGLWWVDLLQNKQ